jgi:hypothetical protein
MRLKGGYAMPGFELTAHTASALAFIAGLTAASSAGKSLLKKHLKTSQNAEGASKK